MSRENNGTEHVVVNGQGGAKCLRCGATIRLELPVQVNDFVVVMKAFTEEHRGCEE